MSAPTILLNNGKNIPQIGFGTSPLNDKEVAPLVVAAPAALVVQPVVAVPPKR